MLPCKRNIAFSCLFALLFAAAFAQTVAAQVLCQPGGRCNGISVGAPKLFDNRTLTLQLESLQKLLEKQRATNPTIDLKSVMAALANTQGLTQSEVSTVLSILANPTPSTGLTTDVKGGNVDSNGNALPNTTDTQNTKNVASVTPALPTFDSFATLPSGFSPTFGQSASDLLNDQVNLSYQIINLQMILERALSDRVNTGCTTAAIPSATDSCTRMQGVVGFNVSIDPPRVANDAVAVVEISLRRVSNPASTTNQDQEMSLVAMMPQEKTYNSAALSSSSHAYSGTAVVNAFQLSGGFRKRNQTFYVYRDTDTIAYERMTKGGEIVFGWMFRPVLGRRSISPGLRQLFAVVSLPQTECAGCQINLTPVVRTYWKKYDRATQTSFEAQDANKAKKFWYGLSATLAKPQIFGINSYLNTFPYSTLTVRSSAFYEAALRPHVDRVNWFPTGEKSVVVSVDGSNFFTNTQVKLGDTTYSEEAKNLVIKSDRSFDLITTVDQLASGPGSILGRYGLSVPLIQLSNPAAGASIENGFRLESPEIGPAIDGYRTLDVSLVKAVGVTDAYLTTVGGAKAAQREASHREVEYAEKNDKVNAKRSELLGGTRSTKKQIVLNSEITKLSDDAEKARVARNQAIVEATNKANAAGQYSLQRE